MILRIISGILILITVYLNVKHGWAGISNRMSPEETKMMTDLGMGTTAIKIISILSFAVAVLVVAPQTFFYGNLLNAGLILLIMALALKSGQTRIALIEIPFLIIPMVMIWLGYPLRK